MNSLASPDSFNTICQNLLERMIDTVPKGVTLTEPVDPVESKVQKVQLFPFNGSLTLNANLRLIDENFNRSVRLVWGDRNGASCLTCSVTSKFSSSSGGTFMANRLDIRFVVYSFTATINLKHSVSEFWFEVDDGTKLDNGGQGYVIDDIVLHDAGRTTVVSLPSGDNAFQIVVAIKIPAKVTKVSIEGFCLVARSQVRSFFRAVSVDIVLDPTNPTMDGYNFYVGNVSTVATSVHINALVDEKEHKLFVKNQDFRKPL